MTLVKYIESKTVYSIYKTDPINWIPTFIGESFTIRKLAEARIKTLLHGKPVDDDFPEYEIKETRLMLIDDID